MPGSVLGLRTPPTSCSPQARDGGQRVGKHMQYNVSGTLIAAFNGCRAQIVQGLGSQAQDWLRNLQGPAQNENLFSLFKNNSGFQDGNRRAFNQVWDPV